VLFQQQFAVVAIYAESRVDREVAGLTLPPS
jgi:hypothetical protein